MAVAELCVGGSGWRIGAVVAATKGIVLLRNVLCEVGCNHLLNLLGLARSSVLGVVYTLAMQVSCALR